MFESVTLEMSLKPFKKTDPSSVRAVCSRLFRQWYPLLNEKKEISILLWVGDGSELLDFADRLDDEFEWAYFIGTANNPLHSKADPAFESLHSRKRLYTKEPPTMTYRVLREIVKTLKEEGRSLFPNSTIRVGETFDIGPEFAVSSFKYERHSEILSGSKLDSFGFVDATRRLNGDSYRYATYPNGIPQGTPFGTFFGRQAQRFLERMGFDYLWLSNGLGFSCEPWVLTGKIFDGQRFYPERLNKTRESVFEFWQLFRRECSFPVETRGTNNTVGIDYATDGVPLYDIYRANIDITPPPNSPWTALTDDMGLELMGHLTRNCELPGDAFKFRFYIHDPWWVNSPWYDRYNSAPYDIYLPMAVSRMDGDGHLHSANQINFLSVDNSFGDLPDSCVYEPLPHVLRAEKDCSDQAPPFILVYPFREFTTATAVEWLKEMYDGDMFMCRALNEGFPLNCVISSDNFLTVPKEALRMSVLVSPAQPNPAVAARLTELAGEGIPVVCYASNKQLTAMTNHTNFAKVDVSDPPHTIVEAVKPFGYDIGFEATEPTERPAMTVGRSNNAFIFSVYNRNTARDTCLKFPLGAPILDGYNVELRNGKAVYRFPKSVHAECRVFVQQESGIVSVAEAAPCSGYYRRRISIRGLDNATVYVFPETYCRENCDFADADKGKMDETPCFSDQWERCYDEQYGYGYKAENISGNYYALMPFPESK